MLCAQSYGQLDSEVANPVANYANVFMAAL